MDVTIEEHSGPRRDLTWSFLLAEETEELVDAYLDLGRVWVARVDGDVVGHVQAVPREEDVWEVTNLAVAEAHRGSGAGRGLLERVAREARGAGVGRLTVATGGADVGNLRFYQRCGFRMTHVVQDAFTPEHGYHRPIVVDGIRLLDQVWFERRL